MNLLLSSLVVLGASLTSTDEPQAQITDMDFWLGEWELTSTLPDGSIGSGTNVITKELGGRIIHEKFTGHGENPMVGESWSGIDPLTKKWKQTWVDNSGSFMVLDMVDVDGQRGFQRTIKNLAGQEVIQRMVFSDVKQDSLHWRWESSRDKGKTWTTTFDVSYKRKSK